MRSKKMTDLPRTKNCKHCFAEFQCDTAKEVRAREFCSVNCAVTYRNLDPAFTEYMRQKVYDNPDVKKKWSEGARRQAAAMTAEALTARGKHASKSHLPEVRAKLSKTLKAMGHKPPIQGGCGRGLTKPQQMLLDRLGPGWHPEFCVKRGYAIEGYPSHYKLDLAVPRKKWGIEVDGFGHMSYAKKEKDMKKVAFLETFGWKVLRLSNREILTDLTASIEKVNAFFGI